MNIKPPYWHPSVSRGFILDWDGVIADTKLDFSGLRERYYGGRKAMLLEDASTLSTENRASFMKELCDLEMEGAAKAEPIPGAFELIDWLTAKEIPYAIVSRNCRESIELAAKTIGLKLTDKVWSRDEQKKVKPHPRSLTEAASSIGLEPGECLLVGDFLYDLQGARRAGMRAVLVQREEPDWEAWADAVYPKMTDLVADLDDPKPFIPWEYREIFAKRGEKWLNAAYQLTLELPDNTSPTFDCWLVRAAALCVGTIKVINDFVLGPTEWKSNQSFEPYFMGLTISTIAKKYLASRYPLVTVTTEGEGMKAPKNSLDLTRFIERKIF